MVFTVLALITHFVCLVSVSPTIETITPLSQAVNETDYVSIYRNASGLPQPSMTWTKLEEGANVLPAGNKLVFNRVNRTDDGTYVCTATNGVLNPATAVSIMYVQCKYYVLVFYLFIYKIRIIRHGLPTETI